MLLGLESSIMKTTSVLIILLAVVSAAGISIGAEKKKGKRPAAPVEVDTAAVQLLKPFDKDGNFEIDRAEFPAVQSAFKASPGGDLKQFDKGGDGELDDTVDRAAMNIKLGQAKMAASAGKSSGKGKKKKKGQ